MNVRWTLARLAAVLALAFAGCGGSGEPAPAKEAQGPAQEQKEAVEPSEHTPASCLAKAGAGSIKNPTPTSWRGLHPDGYVIRVKRFGSPAAAHRAVEDATGATGLAADQANFFGVFGPLEDQDDGATAAVARCLRSF